MPNKLNEVDLACKSKMSTRAETRCTMSKSLSPARLKPKKSDGKSFRRFTQDSVDFYLFNLHLAFSCSFPGKKQIESLHAVPSAWLCDCRGSR